MTDDLSLTCIRVLAGLVLAGHGSQKMFGVLGGPGLQRWTNTVRALRLRPTRLWALAAAGTELAGGLCFALGLLTPIVAALLAVDMLVAIDRIHWRKGLWTANGGAEFPLMLFVIVTAIGLSGPGVWSLDASLGLVPESALAFDLVLLGALALTVLAPEPVRAPMAQAERARPASPRTHRPQHPRPA